MSTDIKDPTYSFFRFLYEDDKLSTKETRAELKSLGVDMSKIDERVSAALAEAEKLSGKSKLKRAAEQRKRIEETLSARKAELRQRYDTKEKLLSAIREHGEGNVQQSLQVQFRGKKLEELSQEDLLSLLADQQALALLTKKGDK